MPELRRDTSASNQTAGEPAVGAALALAVSYRSTGSILPDTGNARTHSKSQIQQIVSSIREFGFTNPILVDEASVIIAGHGRLLAAKTMGLAEVPTVVR